jgi:four helix bundle protein
VLAWRRTFRAAAEWGDLAFTPAASRKLRRGMGMHNPIRLGLQERILEVLTASRPVVDAIGRRDRDLASQLRRALSSIALNAAEGAGTLAGNARLRFQTAYGSAKEAYAAFQVAIVWGYVEDEQTTDVLRALDGVAKRLYGLARR